MLLRGPDTEEVGLRALLVDTGSEYRVRHPKQRGEEAAAGRRRPSGGHHVVHPQNQDESRLSQFEGGMFLCKPVNDDNGCIADEKDWPVSFDVRLSSGFVCVVHHRKQCPRAVRLGLPAIALTKATSGAIP